MTYTIFDVQVAKDHIGETVLFGRCVDDFSSCSMIGTLVKVHDETFTSEPYQDQNDNVFPIIKTVDLAPRLLRMISELTFEEREQLRGFLNNDLYST